MNKTIYALTLSAAVTTAVFLSACGGSSSSSGVTPTGPNDARKADGSCNLSTLDAYLTDDNDSCTTTDSALNVHTYSCTNAGLVTYVINGAQQGSFSTRGLQVPGAAHITTFRCKNHTSHPNQ